MSFNDSFCFRTFTNKDLLPAHGFILNKNTIETFKDCNKLELIDEEGSYIWNKFKNGDVLKDPSILNTFFVLSFAVCYLFLFVNCVVHLFIFFQDLKKYQYYFWFAFPTPNNVNVLLSCKKNICENFTIEEVCIFVVIINCK